MLRYVPPYISFLKNNQNTVDTFPRTKGLKISLRHQCHQLEPTGYEDKTFRENASLTRAHYAVFMHRAQVFNDSKISIDKLDEMTDAELQALTDKEVASMLLAFQYRKDEYFKANNLSVDIKELQKKNHPIFNQLSVKERTNFFIKTNLDKGLEIGISRFVYNIKDTYFGLSYKETVELLNELYTTGKVISSQDYPNGISRFAMYYDHTENILHIARVVCNSSTVCK